MGFDAARAGERRLDREPSARSSTIDLYHHAIYINSKYQSGYANPPGITSRGRLLDTDDILRSTSMGLPSAADAPCSVPAIRAVSPSQGGSHVPVRIRSSVLAPGRRPG